MSFQFLCLLPTWTPAAESDRAPARRRQSVRRVTSLPRVVMVDYGKWDKMVAEMSDEEVGVDAPPRRARVTRLNGPSKITFGGGRGNAVDVEEETATTEGRSAVRLPAAARATGAGTDYGKWDRMVAEMSDEEEEEMGYYEDEVYARVHGDPSLRVGGGVEEGGGDDAEGVYAHERRVVSADDRRGDTSASADDVADVVTPGAAAAAAERGRPSAPPRNDAGSSEPSGPAAATTAPENVNVPRDAAARDDHARLAARVAIFTKNGGREDGVASASSGFAGSRAEGGDGYMWSQDKDEVIVSVVAPAGTRAKDVAVRCTSTSLEVAVCTSGGPGGSHARCLVSDDLAYPIDAEPADSDDEDDTGGGGVKTFGDWEVADFEPTALGGRRVVRVTLRKKGLGMLVHWWRRALKSGREIAPDAIQDRKAGKAEESKRIWEEATAAFREKVKKRELVEVDRG